MKLETTRSLRGATEAALGHTYLPELQIPPRPAPRARIDEAMTLATRTFRSSRFHGGQLHE